ncbi:ABC transporter permease [Deinococcus aquiradiocola]|uniref:Transport permease protein n=1 Tax=Deinococcus aquiradiocola TaxID=393059 RepID=A0A917UUS8_9DEIO|nr:ABC transporter permease [Deinococcus aquiradiocola]GGJ86803.1 ABC transporter [Deinococcus aquiradiocola]
MTQLTGPARPAPLASPAAQARPLTMFTALLRAELRKLLRNRSFLVPSLLLPIMLFALFALPNLDGRLGGVAAGPYLLVSYAAYSLVSTAIFAFGVATATERANGWMRQLRVTPASPGAYLAARVAASVLLGLVSVLLLALFARVAGGVTLGAAQFAGVLLRLLLGMVPFALLGLSLGLALGPTGAAPTANLVTLPLMFASGIFYPLDVAPQFIRTLAPYLPGYHYGQLGWTALGARDSAPLWTHALVLAGYALLFLAVCVWAYRRDEARRA